MQRRFDVLIPVGVFLASLTVYIFTLCPTVYIGDSGEFVAVAHTLGIAHPSGYPLYTLLGKVFVTVLPFLDTPVRVNLLSAVSAALAALVLYFIALRISLIKALASAMSLLFAFSATLWSRATIAEVYALNALFASLAMLFALRWYYDLRDRDLLAAVFLLGLGLGNHLTLALMTPALLILVLVRSWRTVLRWRLVFMSLAFFLLGLSVYLYLPIRASAHPPLNWGDPHSFETFFGHLGFPTPGALFRGGEERILRRLLWLLKQFFTREFWFFGALAFVGIWSFKNDWRLALFFLLVIVSNVAFTLYRKVGIVGDLDAYCLISYVPASIFIGFGIRRVVNWAERFLSSVWMRPLPKLPSVIMLMIPAVILSANWTAADKSENRIGEDFAQNLLASLDPGAVLFTSGDDETFPLWYLRYVKAEATDVDVVNLFILRTEWGKEEIFTRELKIPSSDQASEEGRVEDIVQNLLGRRKLFFRAKVPYSTFSEKYTLLPRGLVTEILPKRSDTVYTFVPWNFHGSQTAQDERSRMLIGFYSEQRLHNARFWKAIGWTDGATQELEAIFSELPFVDPRKVYVARLLLSELYARKGQYLRALEILPEAEHSEEGSWQIYEYRGNIEFMMGDTLGALFDWKESLRQNPANEGLSKNVAALEVGKD